MQSSRQIVRSGAESLIFLPLDPYVVEVPGAPRRDGFTVMTTLRGWSGDLGVQSQLRAVYADAAPHGGRSASFEEMAAQVAARVDQTGLRAYKVHDAGGTGPARPVAFKSGDDAAVPFVDDAGRPVMNRDGRQMMRPAGLPPDSFVDQGRADAKAEDALLSNGSGGGPAVLGYIAGALSKFKQGGSWDAQRVGGSFHPEFVDYATVIIGVYAAASGMSRSDILTVQNSYAALFSHYKGKEMDPTYRHLPAVNVWNTNLGFRLVETGRIGAAKRP